MSLQTQHNGCIPLLGLQDTTRHPFSILYVGTASTQHLNVAQPRSPLLPVHSRTWWFYPALQFISRPGPMTESQTHVSNHILQISAYCSLDISNTTQHAQGCPSPSFHLLWWVYTLLKHTDVRGKSQGWKEVFKLKYQGCAVFSCACKEKINVSSQWWSLFLPYLVSQQ